MGTGIVSIALAADGQQTLSRMLFALAALVWLSQLAGIAQHELRLGEAATLAVVAGTAVLGSRAALLGWTHVGAAALALALLATLVLLPAALVRLRSDVDGTAFLLVVAPESLAVLAALLRPAWLADAALVPLGLGLVLYALVLSRFRLAELRDAQGDHWIAGGALAIATLACAQELDAGVTLGGAMRIAALALWIAVLAWLGALAALEAVEPRLTYDARRWATVFPVGMIAACSFAAGRATGERALTSFARVWVWVALAVWLAVGISSSLWALRRSS